VGLLNAQSLASFCLGKAAVFNQAVDLQCELGFELLTLGVGEAEVSKDVAATPLDDDSPLFMTLHLSSAFL